MTECISCTHRCSNDYTDADGDVLCDHCAEAHDGPVYFRDELQDDAAPVECEANRILARWLRDKADAAQG